MDLNVGLFLSFAIAIQQLFLAIYLLGHKKGNRRNNRILGILFLLFSINFIDFTLRSGGSFLTPAIVHLIDDGFFLLYGPLIFLYIKGVVYRDFKLSLKSAFHFIPFIAYLIYILYLISALKSEEQTEIISNVDSSNISPWIIIASLSVYVHILVYLYLGWQELKTYRTIIKDRFSSIEDVNLNWLSFIVKTFFIITIIALIHNSLPIFGNKLFQYISLFVLFLACLFFINRVLTKALNQPLIFSGISKEESQKYSSSNITEEAIFEFKKQLQGLMETEKMFLQPKLTSHELASHLNTNTKTLSQVLNQGFNKNFFDYVNSYRCEEVMRLLKDQHRNLTIIEAMYESGFNSKSSFNKEFKKLTGQTPSEFKRSQDS